MREKTMRKKRYIRDGSGRAALMLVLMLMAVSVAACGNSAGAEDVTEATELEALSEATELEAVETTEGTEAAVVETTEDTETATEETGAAETETASEAGAESTAADTDNGYTITSLNKTMYAKQSVNVRDLPSTDGSKLGSLSSGQAVTVTGQCEETGWYRIVYDGATGYCSNNYLTDTKPSSGSTGSTGSSNSGSTGSSSGSSTGSSSGSGSSGSGSTAKTGYTQSELDAMADEVITLVNKERKAAGLSSLTKSSLLTEAAQIRAEELATKYSHTRPNGVDWIDILDELGITFSEAAGENIAMGQTTAEEVMEDWMASSGHKANILHSDYGVIGVGVYYDNGTLYWVQDFAGAVEKTGEHTWVKLTVDETGVTYCFDDVVTGEEVYVTYGDIYYQCSVCLKYSLTNN